MPAGTAPRAGVVGVGHLGYHHARLYAALQDVALAGIVDTDPERASRAAGEFCGGNALASVAALLEAGVDAVSVVVPTVAHAEVAVPLLEAGVDVLVEKPLAPNPAEARRIVDAAKANGRILQVGHIERFNGAVIALMGAIRRPRFIEVHRLSPYPQRSTDVSVVLDLMIHDLEILRALDRSEVVSVDAVGVPVFSESEDIANVRIRFASGCVANVTASRISLEKMRKIRVFDEDAYMSTDYSAREVLVYRKKPDSEAADSPMDRIAVEALPVNQDEPLKLELAAFLDCVRTRRRPVVDGQDALAALELAQQITDFMREHAR